MQQTKPAGRAPSRRLVFIVSGVLVILVIILAVVNSILSRRLTIVNHVTRGGVQLLYLDHNDERADKAQLFILNLQSGERTQLTRGGKLFGLPTWSPDGTTIGFTD